jgi:hypothetical protein
MKPNEPTVAPVAARRTREEPVAPFRAEATSMLLMITGLDATYAALSRPGGQNHDHTKGNS